MTALSQFMHAAREILDEQDRRSAPKAQPPFFVRTTWLFAELEELALSKEADTFAAMKVARLGGDIAGVERLVDHVLANTEPLPAGQKRHERRQLCGWIKEQIEREQR